MLSSMSSSFKSSFFVATKAWQPSASSEQLNCLDFNNLFDSMPRSRNQDPAVASLKKAPGQETFHLCGTEAMNMQCSCSACNSGLLANKPSRLGCVGACRGHIDMFHTWAWSIVYRTPPKTYVGGWICTYLQLRVFTHFLRITLRLFPAFLRLFPAFLRVRVRVGCGIRIFFVGPT